jgi:hypothetical protein
VSKFLLGSFSFCPIVEFHASWNPCSDLSTKRLITTQSTIISSKWVQPPLRDSAVGYDIGIVILV